MGNAVPSPEEFQYPDSLCRIVVVSPTAGEECMTALAKLPRNARILAVGNSLEELQREGNLFVEVRHQTT
jgi:hypothetical protein